MTNFLSTSWRKVAALSAASALATTAIACNGETPTSPTSSGITVVPAPTTPVTPPPTSTFNPAPGTTKQLRDLIDALYFCEGPLAHKDSCYGLGTTFGLDPAHRYTVRMSDSFDDRARDRIMTALSKNPLINPVPEFFQQRRAYNARDLPPAQDYTITVIETTDPRTDCIATSAQACATWYTAADGRSVTRGYIFNTFYASTETHELGHINGKSHTNTTDSVMYHHVWHTSETEDDLAAHAAVRAAGLGDKPNVTRAQFLAAGLINPVVPIGNNVTTLVSAPPPRTAANPCVKISANSNAQRCVSLD